MAEYKDITPFIRDLTAMKEIYDAISLDGMIKALNDAPAVDVAPVKHGRWIEADDGDGVVCSECGTDFCTLFYRREDLKYCICGARMDGE